MPGSGDGTVADLSNPIVNSPYEPPTCHFEIGHAGPTGMLLPGRRPSESFIPVPPSRKGRRAAQQELDFDVTGERREKNTLINDIRREVERWRDSVPVVRPPPLHLAADVVDERVLLTTTSDARWSGGG